MSTVMKNRARLVCVQCHGRKIKCDLEESADNTCAYCRRHSITCIRREGVRKRRTTTQRRPRKPSLTDSSSTDLRADISYAFSEGTPDIFAGNTDNPAYIGGHSVLQDGDYDHRMGPPTPGLPANPVAGGFTASVRLSILNATHAHTLPKPALRQALFDAFFTNLSYCFPIVGRADVESPGSSVLLQQAVCLAGSLMRQPNLPDSFPRAQAIYEKIKILICVNFEPNMLTVLKTLSLLTLWSPNPSHIVSLDGPWHATGSAVRLAVQMGMHKNSTYAGKSDRTCRRRLWWLLFASDCVLALIYGRLPALKRDDFDVLPLSEEDFDVVDMQARHFIADISLARIMGELAHKVSRNISPSQEETPIADLLTDWMADLHPDLQLYDKNGHRTAYQFPIVELHIQYFGAVILSQAMSCRFSKQWACSAACLIAANCIAGLYEEILYREQVCLLITMHSFWCLTAAIPLLYYKPDNEEMEAQRKESLGVLCSVIEQLNHRFGIAKTVAKKIKLLQREREDILAQNDAGLDGNALSGDSIVLQNTPPHQLTALFPQLQAWAVRRESGHQNSILDAISRTHFDNETHEVEMTVQWISEAPISAFDALGAPGFMDDFFSTGYLGDEMDFELEAMVPINSV
ncbi:fungal-specific transcription factor domain-containing protein [Aspergillus pseudocaelatus]|uniref:Fungal-specific transcription factor domain-containing protein n=1 Tax=Aspergillus pseudocaelatus TaxID=1825620 RepID=A0ABQ6WB77_9EURO|nr:fungal-specific transcription factor domain-containing protein [Aspergillus pseudocaelatus]